MPPTPGTAVDTATPNMPVRAQRAEIEKVLISSIGRSLQRASRPAGRSAARIGNRSKQSLRVGMLGGREDGLARAPLHDFALSHDCNLITEITDDSQIVAHEYARQ